MQSYERAKQNARESDRKLNDMQRQVARLREQVEGVLSDNKRLRRQRDDAVADLEHLGEKHKHAEQKDRDRLKRVLAELEDKTNQTRKLRADLVKLQNDNLKCRSDLAGECKQRHDRVNRIKLAAQEHTDAFCEFMDAMDAPPPKLTEDDSQTDLEEIIRVKKTANNTEIEVNPIAPRIAAPIAKEDNNEETAFAATDAKRSLEGAAAGEPSSKKPHVVVPTAETPVDVVREELGSSVSEKLAPDTTSAPATPRDDEPLPNAATAPAPSENSASDSDSDSSDSETGALAK